MFNKIRRLDKLPIHSMKPTKFQRKYKLTYSNQYKDMYNIYKLREQVDF